jgi:hypothetical protein
MDNEAVALAAAAGDGDPRTGLRAVAALRKPTDQRAQVRSERARGWSWAEIARELGVTRQAAFKKHGAAYFVDECGVAQRAEREIFPPGVVQLWAAMHGLVLLGGGGYQFPWPDLSQTAIELISSIARLRDLRDVQPA